MWREKIEKMAFHCIRWRIIKINMDSGNEMFQMLDELR